MQHTRKCIPKDRQPSAYVITTGTDDSWYWGVSPIHFVCREHVAVQEPAVIATAEPDTYRDADGRPRPCEGWTPARPYDDDDE